MIRYNLFSFITFMKLVAGKDKIQTTLLKIAKGLLVHKSENSFKTFRSIVRGS